MADHIPSDLKTALRARFSDAPEIKPEGAELLHSMAARSSCRSFRDQEVATSLLDTLCAVALSAPTKSDLQQRDIILLHSVTQRRKLADLIPGQDWVAKAPTILIFCGNNRRQRLLHDWTGLPFANDHLDAFFNAVTDAAIALGAFMTAAEASGLGCCPISAVRNEASAVSDLLGLPQHVFPLAGLAVGYPSAPPSISRRLPLNITCHADRYREPALRDAIETYAQDRAAAQPYIRQRDIDRFGTGAGYTWIDDKTRQYSHAERESFGDYIRAQGFILT